MRIRKVFTEKKINDIVEKGMEKSALEKATDEGMPEPEDPYPPGSPPHQDGYGFHPTPGRHLNGTRALWLTPGKDLLRPQQHLQDRVPSATRHRAKLFSWDQTPLRGASNIT